jgi:glycosyltransferase involved in cell wall biosynthesis
LDSVRSQTYRPLEIIVVDDGSDDKTAEVVEAWKKTHSVESDLEVRPYMRPHAGACAARNWGVIRSQGEFIQFLDSDDLLAPDKIRLQVKTAREHPNTIICASWQHFQVLNGEPRYSVPLEHMDPQGDVIEQWLEGKYLAPHSLLWSRNILERIGPWNENLNVNQDGEYFLRAVMQGFLLKHHPNGAVYKRIDGNGRSISRTYSPEKVVSHEQVLEQLSHELRARGLEEKYRVPMASAWYGLARRYAISSPIEASVFYRKFKSLAPHARIPGTFANHILTHFLGVRRKELLSAWVHKIAGLVSKQ